jgi:serine/threonine-protein kinase
MKQVLKIGLYIILFVYLTVMSSYITFRVMGSKKTATVPNLIGKSLSEASEEVVKKRLYLKIEGKEFSNDYPVDHIVSQDIPANNKIKEGRTIRVILSKGPRINYMPEFFGLNLDEARELAIKKRIKIGKIITVHSDNIEKGMVIAQRPTPDEKGLSRITLLVSKGPFRTLYRCPDFTAMSLDDAKYISSRMGVELALKGYGSIIAEQAPRPGAIIKKGDVVKIKLRYEEREGLRWL